MKALSIIGLLFVAAIIATVPVSPQVTSRGLEMRVDQAQAQVTYGRARRVARRAYRQPYRYAARAGYRAAVYGAGYAYGPSYSYGSSYGYSPVAAPSYGYGVVSAGPGRSCTVYPSGFRWCWTYF